MKGSTHSREYTTVTSAGFPSSKRIANGSTLHFVDTGEQYVYFNGMWEQDYRNAELTALETAQ